MSNEVKISRRLFSAGAVSLSALTLAGCVRPPAQIPMAKILPSGSSYASQYAQNSENARRVAMMYGSVPDEQFPVPAVNLQHISPAFYRARVEYQTNEPVGAIIVNTNTFYAYLVEENGMAMRYGVGLGRAGFAWSGRATMTWKRKWPKWTPPANMIKRQPELEIYSAANGGMAPGLDNPLGARALYIFKNGRDTLYRLHGTGDAWSIGRAVSSGCVRFLNQDIIDLYDRVKDGAPILVV
ncbi:ErfK/YbiS/YcfS/YnhG [hydrothermal vent metagenome]|uniref:ErfK/YbiS/YcfS/YnhG n=1 Tax=hydrothermal vent metagenome TaxID=652676 RepID=A0A3B0TNK1_9ZZZZ